MSLLADLGPAAKPIVPLLLAMIQNTEDDRLPAEATATLIQINAPRPYAAAVVGQVEELSTLTCTASSSHAVDAKGGLRLEVPVAAKGASFLVIGKSE